MESGFVKGDSSNLPRVDVEMVTDFYSKNLQHFSAEMKNVKTQQSSKESYGDNAVCYVQLKRNGPLCIVKAKITPEHKIHKKPYNVEAKINEAEEKVITCTCADCAAALGGCKHSIAFLFWLHRRSEEPSVTSTECYWKVSKLSRVGTTEKFLTIKDMAGKKHSLPAKNPQILENFTSFIVEAQGGLFDFYNKSELSQFDIYLILLQYRSVTTNHSADDFLSFAKNIMGDDLSIVEQKTREQSECSEWYEMRFGRITASKLYETARCKTEAGSLLEAIMGATKPFETSAVKRGKDLEQLVLNRVATIKNIKIKKAGLTLFSNYPVMGASPDGLSEQYCIEIKCPSKEKTVQNYIKDNVIAKKYYFQIQMQMLFCKKEKGLFCVASPKFENDNIVNIIEVDLNKQEIIDILDLAMIYWKNNVFNHLIKM